MVLMSVVMIAGPMIAEGFALPYCWRYAIMLIGISCKEEILIIKKVHISSLAVLGRLPDWFGKYTGFLRSTSKFASSSMAFSPAGVAPQLSPRKLAMKFREIC